jgi:hypothetical protein
MVNEDGMRLTAGERRLRCTCDCEQTLIAGKS